MESKNEPDCQQMVSDGRVEGVARKTSQRVSMAVCSTVITVVGWLLLPFVYQLSLGCAILGAVVGVIAVRGQRGAWRNLGIVSTVAALVLVLVFATFWGAIMLIKQ